MLNHANKSFLGAICKAGACTVSLGGILCSVLLLASSVASAQIVERRAKKLEQIPPASRISARDRAQEFDGLTAQPLNSIRVEVRYKKEYGYKYDSGVFAGSGPSSVDAFSISARPDPSVRLEHLYGTHKIDKMRESNGFYVCDFLVTDLPSNSPIRVGVDLVDHRSLPFEAWRGGSNAQPPPGQQRTIVIVGGRTSGINGVDAEIFAQRIRAQDGLGTVTLTEAQPRATLVFEMIYAPLPLMPPNQLVPRRTQPATPR